MFLTWDTGTLGEKEEAGYFVPQGEGREPDMVTAYPVTL